MNRRSLIAVSLIALTPLRTRAAQCPRSSYCTVVSWFADSAARGLYDDRASTIARAQETIAKLDALPSQNCYSRIHRELYADLLRFAQSSRLWERKDALAWVKQQQRKYCR